MTTAKDLMTPNPRTVDSSTSIDEALQLFLTKKISSVPVFSMMGEVAGQLTEMVLVRALVMHQLQPQKIIKLAHCAEMLEPVIFVQPDDSITTVIRAMMKVPSHRVLVRSDGRKILGIISPKDLLKLVMTGSSEAADIHTALDTKTD